MHRILIGFIVFYLASCAVQAECCQTTRCSPHFFGVRSRGLLSGGPTGFGWHGFRSRIIQGLDGVGFYSRHLFESEQSIHVPYDSWNIYYYDRPYQFRHHETTLLSMQGLARDQLSATYDEIQQRNTPRVGNVDALEFDVLPSDLSLSK